MKLYDFDGVDERLELVPLAARRSLDHAGQKLCLDGWQSLPIEQRRMITELGSQSEVDIDAVTQAVQPADPPAVPMDPEGDPGPDQIPEGVIEAFGEARPLPEAVWVSLTPFDRYALAKVAQSGRAARVAAAYTELVGSTAVSTHLAPRGGVRMVDVAEKAVTKRAAVAESSVSMNREALGRLMRAEAPKGDVLSTARLAGIMAAKRTADLIPLCHPVSVTHINVQLETLESSQSVHIVATVEASDRTGVEMEAMTAASVAALTIYDMLKAFDRRMTVGPTQLLSKSGGREGVFVR